MMKYKMNQRQANCDAITVKATASVNEYPTGQQSTFGNHTTKFDTATRVIAFPAYLKLLLPQFELQMNKELGRGADGVVVIAKVVDQNLAKEAQSRMKLQPPLERVAIKLFKDGVKLLTDAEATQFDPLEDPSASFTQEVAIMSALTGHSSVVSLVGFTEGATCSIVMQLYHGSLSGLIEDVAAHQLLPYASITRQVASALQEMHRYGIVHCDLKRNNVLYEVDDSGDIKVSSQILAWLKCN